MCAQTPLTGHIAPQIQTCSSCGRWSFYSKTQDASKQPIQEKLLKLGQVKRNENWKNHGFFPELTTTSSRYQASSTSTRLVFRMNWLGSFFATSKVPPSWRTFIRDDTPATTGHRHHFVRLTSPIFLLKKFRRLRFTIDSSRLMSVVLSTFLALLTTTQLAQKIFPLREYNENIAYLKPEWSVLDTGFSDLFMTGSGNCDFSSSQTERFRDATCRPLAWVVVEAGSVANWSSTRKQGAKRTKPGPILETSTWKPKHYPDQMPVLAKSASISTRTVQVFSPRPSENGIMGRLTIAFFLRT